MFKKINHIGIAVFNLESASKLYKDAFGLKSGEAEDVPEQKVRVQKFAIGQTRVELLEPQSADSPISKFLKKRGEGIHHICYAVENLERSVKELKRKGLEFIGEPTPGSDGKPVIFIHPRSANGVLIELMEDSEKP